MTSLKFGTLYSRIIIIIIIIIIRSGFPNICFSLRATQINMKEERDFFTSSPILLYPKISFCIAKGWGVCAERDVTQEGSRVKT